MGKDFLFHPMFSCSGVGTVIFGESFCFLTTKGEVFPFVARVVTLRWHWGTKRTAFVFSFALMSTEFWHGQAERVLFVGKDFVSPCPIVFHFP